MVKVYNETEICASKAKIGIEYSPFYENPTLQVACNATKLVYNDINLHLVIITVINDDCAIAIRSK